MTDQTPTAQESQDVIGAVARWVVATAIAGTILIALGAFWLSFTALTDLAARAGIPVGQAWVWPLIVDGIIIVATISVVVLSPYGPRATWYPWALLIIGAIVSVVGNAAHAGIAGHSSLSGPLAAAISAVPPLVLLSITHLTVQLTRRTRAPVEATPKPKPSPTDVKLSGPSRYERQRTAAERRRAGWTNRQIAAHMGVHPSTIGRWLAEAKDETESQEKNFDTSRWSGSSTQTSAR